VLRAAVILTTASLAVWLLPFRIAVRFGSVPVARRRAISIEGCVWAVEAVGRRLPWRCLCIEQGLAAQRMLRAGGSDAVLHYGIRHHPASRNLEAHVWVTVDGRTVVGGEEAGSFAEVATYPLVRL
jgi:hypothetical protein